MGVFKAGGMVISYNDNTFNTLTPQNKRTYIEKLVSNSLPKDTKVPNHVQKAINEAFPTVLAPTPNTPKTEVKQ